MKHDVLEYVEEWDGDSRVYGQSWRGIGCPRICNRAVQQRDDIIFDPFNESKNVTVAKIKNMPLMGHACLSE